MAFTMPNKKNTFFTQKGILALFCLLIAGFFLPAQEGTGLGPRKLTVFKDAAQLTLGGVVRFEDKVARMDPEYPFLTETIEVVESSEFGILYVKFLEDTVMRTVPAADWRDVLEANEGLDLTVMYQVGNDVDELTGKVIFMDPETELFTLRTRNGMEYFMPLQQVRQVILDTLARTRLQKPEYRMLMEIGIDNELPFAPVEVTGLMPWFTWEPTCKLVQATENLCLYQFSAVVINNAADVEGALVELSGASVLEESGNGGSGDERYLVGKVDLMKGDRLLVKVLETQHEYTSISQCSIPWVGPEDGNSRVKPVSSFLRFTNPVNPSLACETMSILNSDRKLISKIPIPETEGKGIKEIQLNSEDKVRVVHTEKEIKRTPKPTKIGDKSYYRAYYEGEITVISTKPEPITLRLTREVFGTVSDPGGATLTESEVNPALNTLFWSIPLKTSQSKKVVYKFEALIPAAE